MREDMGKVWEEKPRHNPEMAEIASRHERRTSKQELRISDPEEVDCGGRQSMKAHFDTRSSEAKEHQVHYAPLNRFLASAVGRKWDDVYAEICALPGNDETKRHILEHISYKVETKTFSENGWIGISDRFGPRTPDAGEFFVDPTDGTLRRAKVKSTKHDYHAQRKAVFDEHRYIDPKHPMVQYHRIKGVWYEIGLAVEPPKLANWTIVLGKPSFNDRILADIMKDRNMAYEPTRQELFGGEYYAKSKRQLGKKEIKKVEQARTSKQRKAA